MLQYEPPPQDFTTTSTAGTVDAQLVLSALRELQLDIGHLRSQLDSVERTGFNNAQRLETIDMLLRARVAAEKKSAPELSRPVTLAPQHTQMAVAAAALSVLLLSPRLRRLVLRSLRALPLGLLALAQLSTSAALLAYRGQDLLAALLIMRQSDGAEAEATARRRRLCHALLLASVAALPAKGVAHLLLPRRHEVPL